MRKLLIAAAVVLVACLAITGTGRVSAETTAQGREFGCGLAQLGRLGIGTSGDAVQAVAGLVRDNTGGTVRELAQRLADTDQPVLLRDQLDSWVASTCR